MTRDADLTLITGFGEEEGFVRPLVDAFDGRLADTVDFALNHRVLLLRHGNNTPLDVMLGALPFEERSVARSSVWDLGEGGLRTCSADDLIVHKVFAGRDQDWLDVRGILIRSGHLLDLQLIERELAPLLELKQAGAHMDRLRKLIEDHL